MAVSTGAIVEGFDVVVDLSRGKLPGCVNALLDPLLLQAAKKDSATALSQQLPRRLMLGSGDVRGRSAATHRGPRIRWSEADVSESDKTDSSEVKWYEIILQRNSVFD